MVKNEYSSLTQVASDVLIVIKVALHGSRWLLGGYDG